VNRAIWETKLILILMGVSGTGKTTLGELLSHDTGWPFLDGDDFHSAANKAKMASGQPLNDEDRAPWLATLHAEILKYSDAGKSMILACSALKEQYRVTLRGNLSQDQLRFSLLEADPKRIADHLSHRSHEYMNPALLASQLATLETPTDAWVVSVEGTPQESLAQLEGYLRGVGAMPV
jgi:gluconokinase